MLFCTLQPVCWMFPCSYRWMTDKPEHHHDNSRGQDEPENQPGQTGIDGCNHQILRCHQHRTRPAVQRAPELQRRFTSCSLRSGVRWRNNHSRPTYRGPGWHSGGQGVCMLETGVIVMVMVMMAVGWELFREVEGLVMSPLLQCAIHAHSDLMITENEGLYKLLWNCERIALSRFCSFSCKPKPLCWSSGNCWKGFKNSYPLMG